MLIRTNAINVFSLPWMISADKELTNALLPVWMPILNIEFQMGNVLAPIHLFGLLATAIGLDARRRHYGIQRKQGHTSISAGFLMSPPVEATWCAI
jgi:hypothetical protein